MKKYLAISIFLIIFSAILFAENYSGEIRKAKKFIKKEEYLSAKNALEIIANSIKDDEQLAEVYSLLAQCSETSSEANQYLEKILSFAKNSYTNQAKYNLAKNLFCNSEYEKAEKYFEEILQNSLFANFNDALYWSAQNYFCLNNYSDCIKNSNKYLETVETKTDNQKLEIAKLNIGSAYFKLNDFSTAIKHFQNLKNSNIDKNFSPNLSYMIGMCYENLQKYDDAIACYIEAINQFPYSEERFLAESQLVNLAENGLYTSTLKMPEIEINLDKKFIVQLAAFSQKEKAEISQKEFKKKGYDTYIFEKLVDGEIWFAVGLGPYKTKAEAKYIQTKLDEDSISSFIYKKL